MSETPVCCNVCGRERGYERGQCFVGESSGLVEEVACYRLGFEGARAALSAAEKERDEARRLNRADEAALKELVARRDAAEKREARLEAAIRWACGERPLEDGRWFDEREFGHDTNDVPPFWWRSVLRLYSGLTERAALELASAASDPKGPPEAILAPPDPPPETA